MLPGYCAASSIQLQQTCIRSVTDSVSPLSLWLPRSQPEKRAQYPCNRNITTIHLPSIQFRLLAVALLLPQQFRLSLASVLLAGILFVAAVVPPLYQMQFFPFGRGALASA